MVFLFAETASCILTEEDFRDCDILVHSNLLVTSQLLATTALYLVSEMSNQHLSYKDTIAFRNVDAGYIVRFFGIAITWGFTLAAFGARPREIIPGSYSAGLTGIMGKVNKGITIALYTLYAVLALWETNHFQFKSLLDEQLTGNLEQETTQRYGTLRRAWLRSWESLNALVARHAVKVEDARTSSLFVWIMSAITWLIMSQIYIAFALLAFSGPDSNEALLFFALYKSNEVLMWPCFSAMQFFDLRKPHERKDSGNRNSRRLFVSATKVFFLIAIVLTAVVSTTIHQETILTDALTCVLQIVLTVVIHFAHKSAVEVESQEVRHNHVYNVVYPKTIQLAFPFLIICAEMMACWIEEYGMLTEGALLKDHRQCSGLSVGCLPLLLVILCEYWRETLYISIETSKFTLENICRLNMDFVGRFQIAGLVMASLFSLANYTMRGKRNVDWKGADGVMCYTFVGIIFVTIIIGNCSSNKQEESSTGRRSSLATVAGRRNRGKRTILWEGGTKGARGKGMIANASRRGIFEEKKREKLSFMGAGEGLGDTTMNPGFI